MTSEIDPTVPGPAGLFFNLRLLSRNAHIAAIPTERAAREALERWCAYCGQRSCYGFGETLTTAGVLSCSDPSCIASAEAEIAERRNSASACDVTASGAAVPQMPSGPLAKPSDETAEPDLFRSVA